MPDDRPWMLLLACIYLFIDRDWTVADFITIRLKVVHVEIDALRVYIAPYTITVGLSHPAILPLPLV